ncbi:hypothetical protein cyc_02921 [Cyclospora cayetanensis]|uniref:Uncharacterized protein n=1 Tax=Cyclospora cayetanensis TaxID=88456 RepID=A0A1D3D7R3_9EIME|nr:hypothetical protein cyc_02921 [Cyclospora cayetanensis]
MVLVTPESFTREAYGPATRSSQKEHLPVLLISACTVDALCCSHMLQVHFWSRSYFTDKQNARGVAVDLLFVRSAADVLSWLDRQVEVSEGASAPLTPVFLAHDSARGSLARSRLPYYERIFLLGLGAFPDEAAPPGSAGGMCSRLYAALTDVLLMRSPQARAVAEVLESHGFAFPRVTPEEALKLIPSDVKGKVEVEIADRVKSLRRNIRIVVLDAMRPVHPALLREEWWLLLVEDNEIEALEAAVSQIEAGAPSRGLYLAKPSALLLAARFSESWFYGIFFSSFLPRALAFVCACSPFIEDDANAESLRLSPDVLVKSAVQEGSVGAPWRQRLQQLTNKLRKQQQTVFGYLRQHLSLPDRLCINWIRHTDDKEAHPPTPKPFHPPPSQHTQYRNRETPLLAARKNAIDALQLLKRLTTSSLTEKAAALQSLQEAQEALKGQLSRLFLQADLMRSSVSQGLLFLSLKQPPAFVWSSHYLRLLCLLGSMRQRGSYASRCLPCLLLVTEEATSREAASRVPEGSNESGAKCVLYCVTPGADKHSPDLFPGVLQAVERLSSSRGPPMVFRDFLDPHLLHITAPRLGLDVQKQAGVLYKEALRRREEMDNDEEVFDGLPQTGATAQEQLPTDEESFSSEAEEEEISEASDDADSSNGEVHPSPEALRKNGTPGGLRRPKGKRPRRAAGTDNENEEGMCVQHSSACNYRRRETRALVFASPLGGCLEVLAPFPLPPCGTESKGSPFVGIIFFVCAGELQRRKLSLQFIARQHPHQAWAIPHFPPSATHPLLSLAYVVIDEPLLYSSFVSCIRGQAPLNRWPSASSFALVAFSDCAFIALFQLLTCFPEAITYKGGHTRRVNPACLCAVALRRRLLR